MSKRVRSASTSTLVPSPPAKRPSTPPRIAVLDCTSVGHLATELSSLVARNDPPCCIHIRGAGSLVLDFDDLAPLADYKKDFALILERCFLHGGDEEKKTLPRLKHIYFHWVYFLLPNGDGGALESAESMVLSCCGNWWVSSFSLPKVEVVEFVPYTDITWHRKVWSESARELLSPSGVPDYRQYDLVFLEVDLKRQIRGRLVEVRECKSDPSQWSRIMASRLGPSKLIVSPDERMVTLDLTINTDEAMWELFDEITRRELKPICIYIKGDGGEVRSLAGLSKLSHRYALVVENCTLALSDYGDIKILAFSVFFDTVHFKESIKEPAVKFPCAEAVKFCNCTGAPTAIFSVQTNVTSLQFEPNPEGETMEQLCGPFENAEIAKCTTTAAEYVQSLQ